MADFENFAGTAADIALRIEQKLVALNIDWHDELALRTLANDALCYDKSRTFPGLDHGGVEKLAHMELCGLIALMNQTITEGENNGQEIHGNDVW
jgi:hypothetical protein